VLEALRKWSAFQPHPNLKGPLTERECFVEVEVRLIIVVQACGSLVRCTIRKVSQHPSSITSPSMSSLRDRTSQQMAPPQTNMGGGVILTEDAWLIEAEA
jgi:hypothetical protein